MDRRTQKHIAKIIQKLSGRVACIELNSHKEIMLKDRHTKETLTKATQGQLSLMASHGLITYQGRDITATDEAKSFLERYNSLNDPFLDQHRSIDRLQCGNGNAATTLTRNIEESPLSSLYRRKTKNGVPFLTDEEFHAGERLRRDFTFGALMPSVTMHWQESSGCKQNGVATDINDETLAARQRVNKALSAVGTDLGSVLIDVCCFLKGMERLEKERQWPVRSAKVVLKTALIALDRHYNPAGKTMPPQYKHIQAMELQTY